MIQYTFFILNVGLACICSAFLVIFQTTFLMLSKIQKNPQGNIESVHFSTQK